MKDESARLLDLATWNRRHHFAFFKEYDKPFWNLCAPVDVTALWQRCRAPGGPSFFASTLHRSLAAANAIEEFRYRLRRGATDEEDGVIVHEVIHGGSTVLRNDETFGFGYFDYDPDFDRFAAHVASVIEEIRRGSEMDVRGDRDNLMHYSVIPWIDFTSFSHARRLDPNNSVPKIVFGKTYEAPGLEGGTVWRMPVSVEVHHALVDGLHVGRFFERFQSLLDRG